MTSPRSVESLAFEIDYWKQVLADVQEALALTGDVGRELVTASVENATAGIMLATAGANDAARNLAADSIANSSERVREAMVRLDALQEAVVKIADAAGGRVIAIDGEIAETLGRGDSDP